MTYLIASDWIIDHLAGRPNAVKLLKELTVGGLAVSIITYAEIYVGIFGGRSPKTSDQIFRRMLLTMDVLLVSQAIARRAAKIGSTLRRQGTSLPLPDVIIAATALHHDLALVTRTLSHYERIPNLKIYREQSQAT